MHLNLNMIKEKNLMKQPLNSIWFQLLKLTTGWSSSIRSFCFNFLLLSWKNKHERSDYCFSFSLFFPCVWNNKALTPIFSTLINALLHKVHIAWEGSFPGFSQLLKWLSSNYGIWKLVFPCDLLDIFVLYLSL